MSTAAPSHKGHRYPAEIINYCVWLYFRFPFSFRDVEEMMLQRGVAVSYETIRRTTGNRLKVNGPAVSRSRMPQTSCAAILFD